ncbi:MAG: hypothetical protein MJ197_08815 [Bacteroidales bacterium]|nr:hypothetical protein [Bacteroidales bacterium]
MFENKTATDIETDYTLYHTMIAIMTKVDGHAPDGSCCGRNKKEHCELFLRNYDKYINTMEKIENRTIKVIVPNQLKYVAAEKKFYNLDVCGDDELKHLLSIGRITEKDVILPQEEVVETPKKAKKSKK